MTIALHGHSPSDVFHEQINELVGHLPALRDADVESVHDARVATRRLREALPLLTKAYPGDVDRLSAMLREVGRCLGRVRELDVMDAGLAQRSGRLVGAAHAIGAARQAVTRRQAAARRKLVKTIDKLGLKAGGGLRVPARPGVWGRLSPGRGPHGWEDLLRERIADRAADLRRTVEHASGVYFPNRAHRVRVAIKKLRYAGELAHATSVWRPAHLVGDLKRAQETLGQLHDAQVLLDSTGDLLLDPVVDPAQVRLLASDLEHEIAQRHADYMSQRARLLDVCTACDRMPRRGLAAGVRPVIAASALALPVGLFWIGAHHR